ncbi:MAG TPA: lysophospholipid acyltransferase family protein [Gemmatimonadales bacterium]|nr:lysophospholipid acyltransferase family protein [Gemmatimonadales bacterium]
MSDAGRGDGRWRRLRIAVVSAVGALVVRALGITWRITTDGRSGLDGCRAAGRPAVLTLWHGELLPLLWAHRGEGIAVLISTHADGEVIARIARSLGCRTVRGSSSRGGARALLALVAELEGGHDVAVTPDGPRGPRRTFAPGAVVAAMRAQAPIVALGATADRAWRLRSWDAFVIPKPFARVRVAYGPPTMVTAGTPRDAEGEAPRFRALQMQVCAPDGA